MTTATETRTRPDAGTAPTVLDVREGLRATLGSTDFDGVWGAVCARAGIPPTASSVSEQAMEGLLDAISGQDRLCCVLAMSWRIRCTAARKLAELGR